jgi:hypothetical protein
MSDVLKADDNKAALLKAKDDKREKMLAFIRDTLIERSQAMRQAYELNPFTYCLGAEGKAQLKGVVAVEAAADIFVHLVAEWQRDDKHPEWLKAIVSQGMATFIEAFKI